VSNAEYIIEHLPITEMLAQLAEECNELAQAALKLRRAVDGTNPTPVSIREASDQLDEEESDVRCCLELLHFYGTEKNLEWMDTVYPKVERWRKRLEEQHLI